MILDCHVHLPSPDAGFNMEWEPCLPGIDAGLSYLQRCGVDGIVASSGRALLAQTPGEVVVGNDELAEAARKNRGFIVPSCLINTNFVDESLAEIRRCHDQLHMVWMGELCGYVTGFSYETPGFAAAINLATDLGMVVQIHNDLPEDMARLCVEHPNTTFVLAHLGDSPEEIEERIHLAVRFPNLYLDISGHGYQRMGVLELAVHEAGADRVLFGSDFTVNDPAGVIARIQMADFDTETKNRLLGGNTNRLLQEHGWKAKGL